MPGKDTRKPESHEIAKRGVYELPFHDSRGGRILVAVDRRGRRLFEATVYPGVRNPGAITNMLRTALEAEDPPHLYPVP